MSKSNLTSSMGSSPAKAAPASKKAVPAAKAPKPAKAAPAPKPAPKAKPAPRAAQPAPKAAPVAVAKVKPVAVAKAPKAPREKDPNTYAAMQANRKPKSEIESPVFHVWNLADNMPGQSRKAVIAKAVEDGVNFYTARTQYQLWRQAHLAAQAEAHKSK